MRKRLRRVDDVIAAVAESGVETRSLSRAMALPKESEMESRGEQADELYSVVSRTDGFFRQVHDVQPAREGLQKERPQSAQVDKGQLIHRKYNGERS